MYAQEGWHGGFELAREIEGSNGSSRLTLFLKNNSRPLTHDFHADWIRTSDDQNAGRVGYTPRFFFDDSRFLFGEVRYRIDEPLDINDEIRAVGGIGSTFQPTSNADVSLEIGAGFRSKDFVLDNGESESDAEAVAIGRASASLKLTRVFLVDAKFDGTAASDQFDAIAETGISARIPTGSIRLSIKGRWRSLDDGETTRISEAFVGYSLGF